MRRVSERSTESAQRPSVIREEKRRRERDKLVGISKVLTVIDVKVQVVEGLYTHRVSRIIMRRLIED